MSRPYRKSKRQESEESTRQRIVEAAMALHEEIGPARTTISALAARAGVQRLTVYRHFPDEARLLRACSSCWMERHPPPDPAGSADGRALLRALYIYYRETAPMWRSVLRDESLMPALREPMGEVRAHLASLAAAVAAGIPESRAAAATAAHAVIFATWEDLSGRGLDDTEIADVAMRWLSAAAG